MVWICSFGVPECPICKRARETFEETQRREKRAKLIAQRVETALLNGTVKITYDRLTGKLKFVGITDAQREGATDECLFQQIKQKGSSLARAQIAKAEQTGGRSLNQRTIG